MEWVSCGGQWTKCAQSGVTGCIFALSCDPEEAGSGICKLGKVVGWMWQSEIWDIVCVYLYLGGETSGIQQKRKSKRQCFNERSCMVLSRLFLELEPQTSKRIKVMMRILNEPLTTWLLRLRPPPPPLSPLSPHPAVGTGQGTLTTFVVPVINGFVIKNTFSKNNFLKGWNDRNFWECFHFPESNWECLNRIKYVFNFMLIRYHINNFSV